jgi:hypothetical protein
MKNIQMLKWLTTLPAERLLKVLFIIVIFTLFTMYIKSENQIEKVRQELYLEKENRRIEERQRTDSFNYIIKLMQSEYSTKYQAYLEEQLEKVERTNKRVNTTISENARIIKNIKNAK